MLKPDYAVPESVPELVRAMNQLILGKGTPSVPLLIYQGAGGTAEGTPGDGPYGAGDGIMVAGDVRELARGYCGRGVPVLYRQLDGAGHVGAMGDWMSAVMPWLGARFAGKDAPENCDAIAPGNSLAEIPMPQSVTAPTGDESSETMQRPSASRPAAPQVPALDPVVKTRGAAASVPDVVAPQNPAGARMTIRNAQARRGAIRITLVCTGQASDTCSATVRVRRAGRSYGARKIAVAGGRSTVITIGLSRAGKRLLTRHQVLTVSVASGAALVVRG